ncbi:MAG: sulfur carrier protein ThiS [Castellaniella sp.]
MNIFLNGEERHITDKASVHDLLVELGYAGKRLAVELNGDIVPRSAHPDTPLKEGDRLEIVIAVGGG